MYKLTLLVLTLKMFLSGFGQATVKNAVSGTVIDSTTTKPVAKATISLLKNEKLEHTATTNESGQFTIADAAPGSYTINISIIGYQTKTLPVTIRSSQETIDLGTISISIESKELKGVTVTAQKALVEDKGDKLIYNAEQDISNAGGTAADVLRKVPNLSVDLNGNVQMRGNSNIKILVNGKPSSMMARNLADALRQMPASVIKTVEVITSPGAKYDAEGAAGIINIITKKGIRGVNGSITASAGNMNRSLGTNISVRKQKLGFNISATGHQNRHINESSSKRVTLLNGTPQNILYRSSEADNVGTGGYGEMSLDYDPDSSSHINFSANVWGGDFPNNNTIQNRLTDPAGRELQSFLTESRFKNPYGNGQLDLGYTKSLKKTDQEFSLLTQYSRMPDNYFYTAERLTNNKIIYREKSSNYSRNKEYTIQADYTHPFIINGRKDTTTIKVEIGTKAIIRDIGSESRVEVSPDGHSDMMPDPSQSNDFDYMQRVYSGYTSLRMSNRRKWTLNAGARLEHTEIEGNFITTGTKLNNNYNNIIPNINISKGIKKHTIKASYTQRITRPLIWYLNPWINQSDPKSINTGNPDLKPELNHMAEIGYNINLPKGMSLNSSIYTRFTDNAIEYLASVDAEGISTSRPENIASRKFYGINFSLSARPNKNWNLNSNGNLSYTKIKSVASQQQNDGLVWSGSLNSTYKLPKDFTIQANGSLSSGWISLQRTNRTLFYWYGISAKRMIWDKKASLSLNINNPFNRGVLQKFDEVAPTFTSESSFLYVNRSARLTFEWRFGQMSADGGKQGKKIRNDDSGR